MIKPSIGRVVLVSCVGSGQTQPYPALIAYVHSDRCINIGGFDFNGVPLNFTSVLLLQDDDAIPASGVYAQWMDYQKGQAAKTESLEQELKSRA